MVKHGTTSGLWVLACKVKRDDSLSKLTWLYVHHIVKARANARHSTALQLRGLHVPEPPFNLSSDDFEMRFGDYEANAPQMKFDRAFDIAAFMRFESARRQ